MSVPSSVRYIRLAGATVAKPVNIRVSGAWHVVQSVPSAPINTAAVANVGAANVSWDVPANSGNIPITGYTVTSSPGNITAITTSTSTTITGLTSGTAYTFTVKATNAVGNSVSSSATSSVTPTATVTGRLYLAPATGSYSSGDTITVTIHADSLTTPVNAVQANFTYSSDLLQFVSISTAGSPFPTTLASSGGGGTIQLSVGTLGADVTGDNVVATVTFSYISNGTAAVAVDAGAEILRSSDSTNILNSTAGASYTLIPGGQIGN